MPSPKKASKGKGSRISGSLETKEPFKVSGSSELTIDSKTTVQKASPITIDAIQQGRCVMVQLKRNKKGGDPSISKIILLSEEDATRMQKARHGKGGKGKGKGKGKRKGHPGAEE